MQIMKCTTTLPMLCRIKLWSLRIYRRWKWIIAMHAISEYIVLRFNVGIFYYSFVWKSRILSLWGTCECTQVSHSKGNTMISLFPLAFFNIYNCHRVEQLATIRNRIEKSLKSREKNGFPHKLTYYTLFLFGFFVLLRGMRFLLLFLLSSKHLWQLTLDLVFLCVLKIPSAYTQCDRGKNRKFYEYTQFAVILLWQLK